MSRVTVAALQAQLVALQESLRLVTIERDMFAVTAHNAIARRDAEAASRGDAPRVAPGRKATVAALRPPLSAAAVAAHNAYRETLRRCREEAIASGKSVLVTPMRQRTAADGPPSAAELLAGNRGE